MTKILEKFVKGKMDKVALFVDGANFFYMQKDKLQWWIDPTKLFQWASGKGQVVEAFYYQAIDEFQNFSQDSYLKALSYAGYSPVTKELKIVHRHDGRGVTRKANFNVEIAVDMFNLIEYYDTVILVSGDADFEYALQKLRANGKKFYVLSTDGFVAREIRQVCGLHFIDINSLRSDLEKTARPPKIEKVGNF